MTEEQEYSQAGVDTIRAWQIGARTRDEHEVLDSVHRGLGGRDSIGMEGGDSTPRMHVGCARWKMVALQTRENCENYAAIIHAGTGKSFACR